VPLGPLVRRIEAETRALSAGRHRLSFEGDDGLQIAGGERELHSAIANLVANAVRYTPAGGSVEVRWRLQGNGTAEVAVIDSGIGIAREHLPRLAQRFYRVDGSRSRDSGGTGLGLSIVKHVVQRHGGELDVRSEVGKGSTFRLVFPAARVRGETEGRMAGAGANRS
jgi:two-component system phosphate regulon sensor histidine kinase PhoR